MGLFEVVGVSSVVPFIAVVTSPELINENIYLNTLYSFFGFQTEVNFIVFLGICIISILLISNSYQAFMTSTITYFSNMQCPPWYSHGLWVRPSWVSGGAVCCSVLHLLPRPSPSKRWAIFFLVYFCKIFIRNSFAYSLTFRVLTAVASQNSSTFHGLFQGKNLRYFVKSLVITWNDWFTQITCKIYITKHNFTVDSQKKFQPIYTVINNDKYQNCQ